MENSMTDYKTQLEELQVRFDNLDSVSSDAFKFQADTIRESDLALQKAQVKLLNIQEFWKAGDMSSVGTEVLGIGDTLWKK